MRNLLLGERLAKRRHHLASVMDLVANLLVPQAFVHVAQRRRAVRAHARRAVAVLATGCAEQHGSCLHVVSLRIGEGAAWSEDRTSHKKRRDSNSISE